MRLFGLLAVFADVLRRFIPHIREQNDFLRAAFFGDFFAAAFFTGGFNVPPVARLYDARPLAFKPPLGFLPAFRCHAGDLAIYFLPLLM